MADREKVRERFAAEPGKGHLAEHALNQRENAEAYGADTSAPDKVLAGLGWPAQAVADAETAAVNRKAEAKASGEGEAAARSRPPRNRKAPPRATQVTAAAAGKPGGGTS